MSLYEVLSLVLAAATLAVNIIILACKIDKKKEPYVR